MTGQLTYTIPGSYSFVCPPDVTSVSVVCVGGGGQSGSSKGTDSTGGGGGGLGYKNNITVVPGNSYLVVVGEGGVNSANGFVFLYFSEIFIYINIDTIIINDTIVVAIPQPTPPSFGAPK